CRTAAGLGDEPRGFRGGRGVDVDAGDRCPLLRKGQRDGAANPAARAADQRRLPRQLHLPLSSRAGLHSMTVPPSTAIVCPVTKPLASDTSHSMVPARSAGTRLRWIVWPALIVSNARSSLLPKNSWVPLTLTAIAASHSASSIWSNRPPCSAP